MFEQEVNLVATVGTLKRELAPILGVAPPYLRLFHSNGTRNGPSGEPLVADRALCVEGLRDSDTVFVEDVRLPTVAGAFFARPCRLMESCSRACARSRPRACAPLPRAARSCEAVVVFTAPSCSISLLQVLEALPRLEQVRSSRCVLCCVAVLPLVCRCVQASACCALAPSAADAWSPQQPESHSLSPSRRRCAPRDARCHRRSVHSSACFSLSTRSARAGVPSGPAVASALRSACAPALFPVLVVLVCVRGDVRARLSAHCFILCGALHLYLALGRFCCRRYSDRPTWHCRLCSPFWPCQ